jgi:hypothetical protein
MGELFLAVSRDLCNENGRHRRPEGKACVQTLKSKSKATSAQRGRRSLRAMKASTSLRRNRALSRPAAASRANGPRGDKISVEKSDEHRVFGGEINRRAVFHHAEMT